MTEKVKLPKDVCDALDALKHIFSDVEIITNCGFNRIKGKQDIVCKQDINIIMRALVLGYEPELTAEEIIKHMYSGLHDSNEDFDFGYRSGVKDALFIHGIKYDWLGDAE